MALITLGEWAKKVGIDPATARQRVNRGVTPAIKVGRDWLIEENTELVDNRKKEKKSMIKYYKVYAQCVNRRNPITELDEKSALDIIRDEVNNEDYGYKVEWKWEYEDPDDDTSDITQECMEEFYDFVEKRLLELFDQYGYIDCGDFRIVKVEDGEEVRRPNACSPSMASLI